VLLVVAAGACGGRTPLFLDDGSEPQDDGGSETGIPPGSDGGIGTPPGDASRPPPDSSGPPPDGPTDAGPPKVIARCDKPAGLQADSPWPIAQRCPARSGATDATGPSAPKVAWTFPGYAGPLGKSIVVAADGTVYVYERGAGVIGIAPDGTERLVYLLPAPATPDGSPGGASTAPEASLAIGQDGTLYAWNGDLTALAPDGTQLWTKEVTASPGLPQGSPAFQLTVGIDGAVYVVDAPADGAGSLVALSTSGGTLWSRSLGVANHPHGSPSVGPDGRIYLTAVDDGHTWSLMVFQRNGDLAWTAQLGTADPDPDPTQASDVPVVISDTGIAYAPCGTDALGPTAFCSFGRNGEGLANVPVGTGYSAMTIAPGGQDLYASTGSGLESFTAAGAPSWTASQSAWAPAILDAQGTLFIGRLGAQQSTNAVTSTGVIAWTAAGGAPLAMGADGTLYGLTMSQGLGNGTNELVALSP
jgi:hypothetical protein